MCSVCFTSSRSYLAGIVSGVVAAIVTLVVCFVCLRPSSVHSHRTVRNCSLCKWTKRAHNSSFYCSPHAERDVECDCVH